MRISDWSSDVCSSDLARTLPLPDVFEHGAARFGPAVDRRSPRGIEKFPARGSGQRAEGDRCIRRPECGEADSFDRLPGVGRDDPERVDIRQLALIGRHAGGRVALDVRSEEHTSELQSLMRISYAVFCLKKKT